MGGQLRLPVIDSFKSVDHDDLTPKMLFQVLKAS